MQSELNVPNLITLAKGLLNDKRTDVYFNMRIFSVTTSLATECGTAGCAIGHAPFYGIKKRADETWLTYSFRTLIGAKNDTTGILGLIQDPVEWSWCFGSEWGYIDNSKIGAAQRIICMLQYGVPKPWGYNQDMVDLYKDITGFCPQWLKENNYA